MATYGGWNGLADGFQKGFALGNEATMNAAKRKALLDEQINSQIERVSGAVDGQLKVMEAIVGQAPQRNPAMDSGIKAQTDQLKDTINGLRGLGTPEAAQAADMLQQRVDTVVPALKTQSEKLTDAELSKQKSIDAAVTAKYGPEGGAPALPVPNLAPASPAPMAGGLGAPPAPPMGGGSPAPVAPAQTPMPDMAAPPPPDMPGLVAQADAAPAPAPAAPAPEEVKPFQTLIQPETGQVDLMNIPSEDVESTLANPNFMYNINGQRIPAIELFKQKYGVDLSEAVNGPQEPGSGISDREAYRRQLSGYKESDQEKQNNKEKAKQYTTAKKAHQDAIAIIRTVANQREALARGIFTGFGSSVMMDAARVKKAVGAGDDPRIANTQVFMREASENAAKIIKQFGAGTGLSDTDREFAYRLAAGDTSMDEETLKRSLDSITKAALWVVANPDKVGAADPMALRNDAHRLGVNLPENF